MLTDKWAQDMRNALDADDMHAVFEANGSLAGHHTLKEKVIHLATRVLAYHDENTRLRSEVERLRGILEDAAVRAASGELATFAVDEGLADYTEACRVSDVAAFLRDALAREERSWCPSAE